MASNAELYRLLAEMKQEIASLKGSRAAAPATEAPAEEAVDPEAPPAADVIKSRPPGGLQQWVEGVRPGDPKAWHYAKGIGRKFIGPKSEAALRYQLRGEDYMDALAKATAGRADFEKSDPIISETTEQARNYGALGVGGGLAYLAFGSKKNKLPDNPNMGEIHGYIDRHDVPVSTREAPKSVLVKEIRDWETKQRPLNKLMGGGMPSVSPGLTSTLKGPGTLVGAGLVANALMGREDPGDAERARMDFAPMGRRFADAHMREMNGENRRWNAKAIEALAEQKPELQSRPGISGSEVLGALATRNPIGAALSTLFMPTPAEGGELTPADRARATADQYLGAEEIPAGTMAPKDARLDQNIRTRVEREADRLMGGKGVPQPQAPQPQPQPQEVPAPQSQSGAADPYAGAEDIGGNSIPTGQQGASGSAGRFALPGIAPRQRSAGEVATDVVKSAGSGMVKGLVGVGALPGTIEQLGRMGINYANRQFGGKEDIVSNTPQVFPNYPAAKQIVENKLTGSLYDPQTVPGKYAGTAGEFATGMLFPAGRASTLGERAMLNVAGPAVASETAGQLTEGTAAETYARVAGALVGGQLPQTIGRAVSPNVIDPQRARAGQVLAQEGVPLTAGDRTGSKAVRWMESNAADTPLSGNRAQVVKEQQAERFTQAALRRAGINEPRATPDVLDQAFTRIGQDFDTVAQNLTVPVTPNLAQQAQTIAQRYERITEPTLQNPLVRQLADDLANRAQPAGGLPVAQSMLGDVYRGWRSDLGAAARGAGSARVQDHRTERAIYEMQRLLDDAAEQYLRGTNPQLADTWRRARTEYRNLLPIERAATAAGENAALGLISPAQLRNATISLHGRRNYARGDGDFADLARSGEALLKPLPQSGTNPRAMASAGGAAIGSALFSIPGAAAGALAPMAGQAMLGRMTMSAPMQAYLQNQLMAGTRQMPAGSRVGVIPGTVVQYDDGQPTNALMRR